MENSLFACMVCGQGFSSYAERDAHNQKMHPEMRTGATQQRETSNLDQPQQPWTINQASVQNPVSGDGERSNPRTPTATTQNAQPNQTGTHQSNDNASANKNITPQSTSNSQTLGTGNSQPDQTHLSQYRAEIGTMTDDESTSMPWTRVQSTRSLTRHEHSSRREILR